MELMVRAAAICLPAAFFVLLLRKTSPEMALALSAAAALAVLLLTARVLSQLIDFVRELAEMTGVGSAVMGAIVKTVGIAVIARFTADLMKDAGMSTASSAAELIGAAAGLFAAMPVIRTMLSMIRGLL